MALIGTFFPLPVENMLQIMTSLPDTVLSPDIIVWLFFGKKRY